jgi:hypothetical protein
MQQLLHVVPTVDNTVGALLLGIIAAAVYVNAYVRLATSSRLTSLRTLSGYLGLRVYKGFYTFIGIRGMRYGRKSLWRRYGKCLYHSILILPYVAQALLTHWVILFRVLDVVHFSLAIHLVYTYAVRGFEDPSLLSKLIWCARLYSHIP